MMLDFIPEVYQVVAGDNYTVYAYLNDGSIRLYDVKPLIKNNSIFQCLRDNNIFRNKLTVLNNTVAWDIGGNRGTHNCIDIDPFEIINSPKVSDILEP